MFILKFYRKHCKVDACGVILPNNYENVIVIVADLLILYARIVNLTFKNYLWEPFLRSKTTQRTKKPNRQLNSFTKINLEKQ